MPWRDKYGHTAAEGWSDQATDGYASMQEWSHGDPSLSQNDRFAEDGFVLPATSGVEEVGVADLGDRPF